MISLGRLDEEKGSLRILLALLYNQTDSRMMELIDHLETEGVGRTAFYSSYGTLIDLGLVYRADDSENRKIVLTALTDKGRNVAMKLLDIKDLLEPDVKG